MSGEFELLKEEIDKAKGIAKRVYSIIEVGTGWNLPKIKARGIPIDEGLYYPTPETMLDAAIKIFEETKSKKGRLSHPGQSWPPLNEPPSKNFLVERIVNKLKSENKIDIEVAADLFDNVMNEPEQFPGLIYRMSDPKTVLLVFASGKVVCTGG